MERKGFDMWPTERGSDGDSSRTVRGGTQAEIVGPSGRPMSLADLPPRGTKRWVIRRKAEVVAAVKGGLLTLEDACRRYNLSVEEFEHWQRLINRHGVQGLRATRIKQYREVSLKR